MKNLIKSKVFIGTFLTSYVLFFFVLVPYINEMKKGGLSITYEENGFPFVHYYSHCFGVQVSWFGFVGNVLVATIFSLFIGLIFKFIWSRITSHRLR
jgi:hypothetical protein